MHKKMFLLFLLLAFAIGLSAPTGPAAAAEEGAKHVYFNVTETNLCYSGAYSGPECSFGTPRKLTNGKSFVYGYKTVVQFTALDDPRWTALCFFSGDPFPPGGPATFPVTGSWVCTPNDPAHPEFATGWWEGRTTNTMMNGKMVYVWSGKGFGALDGLLVIHRNIINNPENIVEIIELPGYQQ